MTIFACISSGPFANSAAIREPRASQAWCPHASMLVDWNTRPARGRRLPGPRGRHGHGSSSPTRGFASHYTGGIWRGVSSATPAWCPIIGSRRRPVTCRSLSRSENAPGRAAQPPLFDPPSVRPTREGLVLERRIPRLGRRPALREERS
ncbi:Mannonate dehydratase 2 [Clarias magur]|uniref:Mannonate dehydratase 2 n=1 Tax=Clarias magur TaxID=1594786 RepID=A0A8J4TZ23_CLAMG|nr:Mannonate dehydratase 2 [Clarias magur]